MAVDWLKIKTDYINGGISYRQLAEKYGTPLRTIAKHAKDERWKEERDEHCNNVATELQQKMVEKISEALSDEASAKARIRSKLISMTENWLNKQGEIRQTGDFRRMVQCCVDLGVMDAQDTQNMADDGLLEALGINAGKLFDSNDDSDMLPEEDE